MVLLCLPLDIYEGVVKLADVVLGALHNVSLRVAEAVQLLRDKVHHHDWVILDELDVEERDIVHVEHLRIPRALLRLERSLFGGEALDHLGRAILLDGAKVTGRVRREHVRDLRADFRDEVGE